LPLSRLMRPSKLSGAERVRPWPRPPDWRQYDDVGHRRLAVGFKDRAKAGLVGRLVKDGIYEPLAILFAEADYPSKTPVDGLPKPIVSPAEAGRIIEREINPGPGTDAWSVLARMQEEDRGAAMRTNALARSLFGMSAGALAESFYGAGFAETWGLEFPERTT
jgi:hypothetical protein